MKSAVAVADAHEQPAPKHRQPPQPQLSQSDHLSHSNHHRPQHRLVAPQYPSTAAPQPVDSALCPALPRPGSGVAARLAGSGAAEW